MPNFLRKSRYTCLILLATLLINPSLAAAEETADDAPALDCTLTDQITADGKPASATDTFTPTTPIVYLICDSDEVTKGQKLKAEWIAADTKNAAPPNYKIDEKAFDVTKDLGAGEVWTVTFSLSKPTKGWPPGTYHVDVYADDKLALSAPFTVK